MIVSLITAKTYGVLPSRYKIQLFGRCIKLKKNWREKKTFLSKNCNQAVFLTANVFAPRLDLKPIKEKSVTFESFHHSFILVCHRKVKKKTVKNSFFSS